MWYHTLTIMLRRPELEVMRNSFSETQDQGQFDAHWSADHICTTAASEIGSIVYHCINTTGAGLLGFGSAYGVYTAATAVTYPLIRLATSKSRTPIEIAHSEPGLLLGFFVDTLVKMKPTMPGIERSFLMLTKHIIKMLGKEIAGYVFSSHAQKEGSTGILTAPEASIITGTEAANSRDAFMSDQGAIDALFSLSGGDVRGLGVGAAQTSITFDQYLLSQDYSTDDGNFNTLPIFPGTLLELISTDLLNTQFDQYPSTYSAL
jgi:hypothetical protein